MIVKLEKLIPAYIHIEIKSLYTIKQQKIFDNKIKFLFELIDNEKYNEAEIELKKLESEYGYDIRELNKAKAIICFLKDYEDYNK